MSTLIGAAAAVAQPLRDRFELFQVSRLEDVWMDRDSLDNAHNSSANQDRSYKNGSNT